MITTTTAATTILTAAAATTTITTVMIITTVIIIIIMMMMMIIIIIIALKGAIRDILQSHCAANCLKHVRSSGQGAIVCKSRAAQTAYYVQHVVCHVLRRDGSASKVDRVEIAFILALLTPTHQDRIAFWLFVLCAPITNQLPPSHTDRSVAPSKLLRGVIRGEFGE